MTKRQLWATAKTRELLDQFGLFSWDVAFTNSVTRLGQCDFGNREIRLSRLYVEHNAEEHITDTILHEIAHALVGLEHGHDERWKEMAAAIGATPEADCNDATMPGKFQAICCQCGQRHHLYRKPNNAKVYHCRCQALEPLIWRKGETLSLCG